MSYAEAAESIIPPMLGFLWQTPTQRMNPCCPDLPSQPQDSVKDAKGSSRLARHLEQALNE